MRQKLRSNRPRTVPAARLFSVQVLQGPLGENSPYVLVKHSPAPLAHLGRPQVPMTLDVLEEGKTECHDPLGKRRLGGPFRRTKRAEHLVDVADEQIILVAKVGVEGRSANVGALEDCANGDALICFRANQGAERIVRQTARPLDAPVGRAIGRTRTRRLPARWRSHGHLRASSAPFMDKTHDIVRYRTERPPSFFGVGPREATLEAEQMSIYEVARMAEEATLSRPLGAVLHSALLYDLSLGLQFLGRERAFREKLLALAHLAPGETVLDVGCGTGTLAILARRHVGPTGAVCGIDASGQMIARAQAKSRRAGVEVKFQTAPAQALPFPDASSDVVLATLMLHHLGRNGRRELAGEMRRVIKADGRVLIVDFESSTRKSRGLAARIHRGHGHVDLREVIALLDTAGLGVVESGAVGSRNLHYALAKPPKSP